MSAGAGNPIEAEEYERHATWLRQLARSMAHDPATLDDIVQETWLSFLRHGPVRDGNQPESSPRPWLRRVMENAAAKFYRGEGRRTSRERLAFEEPEPLESAAELVESADLVHTLMGEVRELSEPLRSTVLLRYLKGLSAAEIARRSGDPEGTVRWRLSAARDELRERMDRKVGSRERWAALTLPLGAPLLGQPVGQSASTAGGTPLKVAGPGELGGRTALAGAAACALVAAGAWLVLGPTAPTIEDLAEGEIVSAPAAQDTLVSPVRSRAGDRVPVGSLAYGATIKPMPTDHSNRPPAIERDQAGLSVHLVDQGGNPVRQVLLRWADSRDVFTHTDHLGNAELVFRPPVTSAPLQFILEAGGFATSSFTANIRAGEVVRCGTRSMTRAVRRTGTVRNAAGEPMPGARVWIAPAQGKPDRLSRSAPPPWPDFERSSVRTGPGGEFQFPGAPSLPTRLWATAPGCWFTVSDVLDSNEAEPMHLVLKALPGGGEISGRVVDANGAPLGDVLVRLVPRPKGTQWTDVLEVETSADGKFQFQPRATGRHRMIAEDLLDRFDDEAMEAIAPGSVDLELRMTTPL